MAKAKTAAVVDIWKRKKWHRILAPKIFNEQVIGETPAFEPSMLAERTICANLMHLTRDMKKQNINITFEVTKVLGDTAHTQVKAFEINPSSIKRFVRRGKQRIDDSFVCLTADNKRVRIKPFFITSISLKSSIIKSLRKKAKEFLAAKFRKTKSDVLMQDIVNHRLQREMKDILSKIYPLRVCEIRMLVFEKENKKEGAEEAEEEEIKEEPKPEVKEETKKEEAKPAENKEEKPKEEAPKEKKAEKKEKKIEEAGKEEKAEEKAGRKEEAKEGK